MWRCRIGRLIKQKKGLRTNKEEECLKLIVGVTSNKKTTNKKNISSGRKKSRN